MVFISKRKKPSFRFRAAADATTIWDLIVVFPWALSNVVSGTPILYTPFIDQAKYVADYRTYYWETRNPDAQKVIHPQTNPYPSTGSSYLDIAKDDQGGNFGRIARITELMGDWINNSMNLKLAGIEARWWVQFFNLFKEQRDKEKFLKDFERLTKNIKKSS